MPKKTLNKSKKTVKTVKKNVSSKVASKSKVLKSKDKKSAVAKPKVGVSKLVKGKKDKPISKILAKAKASKEEKSAAIDKKSLKSKKEIAVEVVSEAPRKRGRPPKIKTPEMIAAELNAVPKKRGRKSKAELEAIAKGLDPRTVLQNQQAASTYSPGGIPLGQPIKRKRGRPRKNEQYGIGGAMLTSELMARGIRRFGVPIGGTDIPIARYSWSAETGEHSANKTANFSSAESGEEIYGNDDVEFSKGDKVVYPAHGLGVIQAIQSRMVSGAQQKFYLISIIETGMKIMVPVSQSRTVGLRRVVDHSTVDRVYAILKDKSVSIDNQTWNRRYREYSQKIKTGSVLEIASVIRDLTVLKVEKELSFNERRMLDTAQGLLVKELSIAKSASEDLIKEELDQICQF